MSFSNEEQIEEILYEAHAYGFRTELWKKVEKYKTKYPKMSAIERYEKAFNKLVSKHGKEV